MHVHACLLLPAGDQGAPEAAAAHAAEYVPPHTAAQLEVLASALQSRRSVLLEGESGCGKSHLLKLLAKLTRRTVVVMDMHSETGEEGGLANVCV